MDIRTQLKAWSPVLIIVGMFVVSSYFAQKYSEPIGRYVDQGPIAVAIVAYILLTILSTVIPPVTSLPLIPVAATAWGSLGAGIMTAGGWIAGSVIAFWIARRYGHDVVKKLMSEKSLEKIQEYIPAREKGTFWFLAFLQMVLPVDVLCYGIGLFTKVPFRTYIGATAIGILPGAMLFAYAGTLSVGWQLALFALGGIVFLIGSRILRHSSRRHGSSLRHAF